jgi:hypothetical protein
VPSPTDSFGYANRELAAQVVIVDVDAAGVRLDEPTRYREPQPSTAIATTCVVATKGGLEDSVQVVLRDAAALVDHREHERVAVQTALEAYDPA